MRCSRVTPTFLALICLVAAAYAADQAILGKQLNVKDAKPGVDPTKRKVIAQGKETGANTIVGDPTTGGATLTVFANGTIPSTQSWVLPQTNWSASGTTGFKYKDRLLTASPVKVAQIKAANGKFQIKVVALGKAGGITLVPPNLGTDGCLLFEIGGGDRYHLLFPAAPASTIKKNDAKSFLVKDVLVEGICPGTVATSTTTTTSSTTTSSTSTTTSSTSTSTSSTTSSSTSSSSSTSTTSSTTTTTLACPFVTAFGTNGVGPGEFNGVRLGGVAVDGSGNVYTVEDGGGANNRVQKFTNGGTFLLEWGGAGSGDTQFGDPEVIAADAAGNVYVGDALNKRIQKFTDTGAFVLKWGSNGNPFFDVYAVALDPSGTTVVVADSDGGGNGVIRRFTDTGTPINSWYTGVVGSPRRDSLAVDASGNVIFATGLNSVFVFTSAGSLVTQWGGTGTGDGQFTSPWGLARNSGGDVFVGNIGNPQLPRIQRFSSTGTYLAQWGSLGSGVGQFSGISSVAVDASNNVFVADSLNSRVQKFACP